MSATARSFWVVAPGVGELREEPMRAPAPGEVLVRTLASGISRGTESLVFDGRVPASLVASMRAPFQDGELPAPVKYGYAAVGMVQQGPHGWAGRRVFCLHPHQDRFVVPVADARPVPDGVPSRRAVLAANLETAVNAVWDAAPSVGDHVTVVGAGTVGLCVALLCARFPGVQLEVVDTSAARRAVAAAAGLRAVMPGEARGERDLVVHATGRGTGLAIALGLAGLEATVLELSWFGAGDVAAPLGEAFHARRLRLVASQVGLVSPTHRPRWTNHRRLDLALSLLVDERFDALVGDADEAFEELPVRYPAILADRDGVPTPVVVYR